MSRIHVRKAWRPLGLNGLRGFEVTARRLSFTLAARELNLTQSAVSHQIHALEEELGQALFLRRPRQLTLTEAGEQLYRLVSRLLRELDASVDAIRSAPRRQSVTVSTFASFASQWLVPRLEQFNAAEPNVDVRVVATDRFIDLEQEGVDVAVRHCPQRVAPKDSTLLFGEQLFPVCSPKLLQKSAAALKHVEDLRHFILLDLQDNETPAPVLAWQTWLRANGADDMLTARRITFNFSDQMIQAAIRGQGVALGRSVLVADALRRGELVAPLPQRLDSTRSYYLVVADSAATRREVQAFCSWLKREAGAVRVGAVTAKRRASKV